MAISDQDLVQINERGKAAKRRCKLIRRGQSLYSRASLPPKVGGGPAKQQWLPLKAITSAGDAEVAMIRLDNELRTGTFEWRNWMEDPEKALFTVEDFWKAARRSYLKDNKNEGAWKGKWSTALRKLGPNHDLLCNELLLVKTVEGLPPNTDGRRDTAGVFAKVAKSLGIPPEKIREAGKGKIKRKPKYIPTDTEIEQLYGLIKLPHWRWMYGICATYGIRAHEIVEGKLLDDGTFEIQENTKSGYHIAWPIKESWIKRFNLTEVHRPPQSLETITKVANDYLWDRGPLPFTLGSLRHAYAIRCIGRIPVEIAADCMGHTLEVHQRDYKRWLDYEEQKKKRSQFDLG